MTDHDAWPDLPLDAWEPTFATLHRWTQIVGKVRLARTPWINHSWHVVLYPTSRGLTTSPMADGVRTFDIDFDFVDHRLLVQTSDGRAGGFALTPMPVAHFYARVLETLAALGIHVAIHGTPNEIEDATPFTDDHAHASYDPDFVNRWWRIVARTTAVLQGFRARFIGKCSPIHFFWGSFDLAVTRFNGRRAPERAGADSMTREAYSHEVLSAGFWPGSGSMQEAAFYAYAAPEPLGYKAASVGPRAAFYSPEFNEFILKYEDVRTAPSPREALLEFLQTTYEAGARIANWNRQELERA